MSKLTWNKNRSFKYAAVKMILNRNFGLDDKTDLEALYDNTLTIKENINAILENLKLNKRVAVCPCCLRVLK